MRLKDYVDKKVAICCNTKEEWDELHDLLAKEGVRTTTRTSWGSYSRAPLGLTLNSDNTAYWCSKEWYEKTKWEILDFSSLLTQELYQIY